jgi:creatinine amidohydrolase
VGDGILTEMTIEQVRAMEPEVVALGVGSVEPHGPALPYGTDYFQCDAVVRRGVELANAGGARALMYPTLPIGCNVNFKAWPFACRIRVQTLMATLLDIISALEEDGIRKVVLYDGHGGNTDAIRATLRAHFDAAAPDRRAFVCMASSPAEASRMLHLRGDLVRADKLGDLKFGKLAVEGLAESGAHFVRPWDRHVPASAGGDARKASAEKGRKIIEAEAEHLAALLTGLSRTPWTEAFPYEP